MLIIHATKPNLLKVLFNPRTQDSHFFYYFFGANVNSLTFAPCLSQNSKGL